MPIVVQCNSCKKKIKAPDKFAGKRVKCPGCQSVLAIPAASQGAASPMPAQPSPKPAAPAPQPSFASSSLLDDEIPIRQEAPPAQATADSLADLLDDDIPIRQEPAAQPVVKGPSNCPGCGSAVSPGAALCVDCGYDFRTQAKHTSDAGSGGKKKKRRRASENSDRLIQILRGCGISAISVVIGIVIWYGIAMLTGFELGIIAWMLGGAAGIGMAVGCGENGTNAFTGFLAALITFFGIFVARMAIVITIIAPMLLAAANAPDEFMDEEFGNEMAFDVPNAEIEADSQGEAVDEGADAVGDDEMAAEEEEAQEAPEEAFAEEDMDQGEMPAMEVGLGGIIIGFFVFFGLVMFGGIYQAVFVILAVATAFRVGMTGVVDND